MSTNPKLCKSSIPILSQRATLLYSLYIVFIHLLCQHQQWITWRRPGTQTCPRTCTVLLCMFQTRTDRSQNITFSKLKLSKMLVTYSLNSQKHIVPDAVLPLFGMKTAFFASLLAQKPTLVNWKQKNPPTHFAERGDETYPVWKKK